MAVSDAQQLDGDHENHLKLVGYEKRPSQAVDQCLWPATLFRIYDNIFEKWP